jgi:hypothetical protein
MTSHYEEIKKIKLNTSVHTYKGKVFPSTGLGGP